MLKPKQLSYLLIIILGQMVCTVYCTQKFTIQMNKKQKMDIKSFFQDLITLKADLVAKNKQQLFGNKSISKIQWHQLSSEFKDKHKILNTKPQNQNELIPLYSNFGTFYTASVGIGQNQQQFNLKFSTDSNELWVAQDTCSTCLFGEQRYTCLENTCQLSTQKEISYQNASFQTHSAQDLITLGKTSTSFPFFTVFDVNDIFNQMAGSKNDGNIGFGVSKNDSIVNKLFKEKKIEKNMFSLKIPRGFLVPQEENEEVDVTSEPLQSDLIIGGVDKNYEKDMSYYKVTKSDSWSFKMGQVKFGKKKLTSKNDIRTATIQLGSAAIIMPPSESKIFKEAIDLINKECISFLGVFTYCTCTSQTSVDKYPPLYITLSDMNEKNQMIVIQPRDYILYHEGYCFFLLLQTPEDFGMFDPDQNKNNKQNTIVNDRWILGELFLQNTYNVFNYEKNAIGIKSYVNNNTGDDDDDDDDEGSGFIIFVLLIIIAGGGYFAYIQYKKKREAEQQQQQQQQYQQQQYQQHTQDIPLNDLNQNLVQQQ